MDRALLETQLASVAAELGGAFGGFVYTPASGPAVTLKGPCAPLAPDDPRLEGGYDRLLALAVSTAALPAGLAIGHELARLGRVHRVVRIDHEPHGLTTLLLTA